MNKAQKQLDRQHTAILSLDLLWKYRQISNIEMMDLIFDRKLTPIISMIIMDL